MPERAKSKADTRRALSKLKGEWMVKAMSMYKNDQKQARRGSRVFRKQAEDGCYKQTKIIIRLSPTTLMRRVNGGRSIRDFNAEKRWLTGEEEATAAAYEIEQVKGGFPPSLKRIKEHVDQICFARFGSGSNSKFPETGVGENWAERFIDICPDLQTYWAHALDHSRARAVNPVMKPIFFGLVESTIEGEGGVDVIPVALLFGADESGFQEGRGGKERVVGGVGKTMQHQQRGGDRQISLCL
jgi:hypothetical protein